MTISRTRSAGWRWTAAAAACALVLVACGGDDDDATPADDTSEASGADEATGDTADDSSDGSADDSTDGGTVEATEGSSGDYGFDTEDQDADATITVWVDATREPLANAFVEAYPDVPVTIETYDGNAGGSDSLRTQVALFDQADQGWPDVAFSTQVNDASWASAPLTPNSDPWAAPLNQGFMDQAWLDGFTAGALDPVTVDGTVYGLRNDLAPVVLWYDQSLMDEFGYEVPTTWEEYEALGADLAENHPGYVMGSIGDSFVTSFVYYWGAKAPIFQLDGNTFSSDFSDDYSQRMTAMLDRMVANETLVIDSVFSAEFADNYAGKIVAMPGPAWYAGVLFENPDTLGYEPGVVGIADPLHWDGDDEVTGSVGGGVWYASSHSKNLEAVEQFLQFVIDEGALEFASGLPAYDSVAQSWLEQQAESGFYQGDFAGAINTAATSVWDGWGYPTFSAEGAFADIVLPSLAAGGTIAEVADDVQKEYENTAQVNGYDNG